MEMNHSTVASSAASSVPDHEADKGRVFSLPAAPSVAADVTAGSTPREPSSSNNNARKISKNGPENTLMAAVAGSLGSSIDTLKRGMNAAANRMTVVARQNFRLLEHLHEVMQSDMINKIHIHVNKGLIEEYVQLQP